MEAAAFARAYLQTVGANTLGEGLRSAADFIQPTVELLPFLGLNRRVQITPPSFTLTAGVQSVLTVPDDEVWLLRHASMEVTTGAGENAVAATLCLAGVNGGAGSGFLALFGGLSPGASSRSVAAYNNPSGLLLQPKDSLMTRTLSVTGVPSAAVSVLYDRLTGKT